MVKKRKVKTDWQGTIIFWGGVVAIFFGITHILNPKYYAYKCDYTAISLSNILQVRKEFGGDPCTKKGKNRFKIYYVREFKSKSDCENFLNTASPRTLRAPSSQYVLGCDKK